MKHRQFLAALAVAAVSLATPALADGMDKKASIKDAPAAVETTRWSGPYIGVYLGGASTRTDASIDPALVNSARFAYNQGFRDSGVVAGINVGYDWQRGSVVFGVLADVTALNARGEGILDVIDRDELYQTRLSTLGTVRARLGLAMGDTLPYITGGLAYGKVQGAYLNYVDATRAVLQDNINGSATRRGWALGVGVERKFAPNWSVKLEYLHADLGTLTVPGIFGGTDAGKFDVNTNMVTVGINYRF